MRRLLLVDIILIDYYLSVNVWIFACCRKLLAAADKYNIVDLKVECERSLCSSMTVETVSSLLIFAQDRHVTELKRKCIEFISKNIQGSQQNQSYDVNCSIWKLLVVP